MCLYISYSVNFVDQVFMRAFIFTKYILILLFSAGLVLNRVLVYLQFVIQAEFAQLAVQNFIT